MSDNTNDMVTLLVTPASGRASEAREIEVNLADWAQFAQGDTDAVVRRVNLQPGETIRVKRGFFSPRVRIQRTWKVA